MNENIHPNRLIECFNRIEDGNMFEAFAQGFLASIVGSTFIPHGGFKDKGIDGLESIYERVGDPSTFIYQISIDKDPINKIRKTIRSLNKNDINYTKLIYVTNQAVKDQSTITNEIYNEHTKHLTISDQKWFASNLNMNNGSKNAFNIFIESHVHKFKSSGSDFVIIDQIKDPRVYVFLRQQIDFSTDTSLNKQLLDTLVLFALEDTDPDLKKFRNKDQIINKISESLTFEPKFLIQQLDKCLNRLSRKPNRKINFHSKEDSYCLPHETRIEIAKKISEDQAIYDSFKSTSMEKFDKHLGDLSKSIRNKDDLIEKTLHKIYAKIGFQYSNFIINKQFSDSLEHSLSETISLVISDASINPSHKELVMQALLGTFRSITYEGTLDEKKYIEKLSHTYLILFLLQCDPAVSQFFENMADNLSVFVGTSVIIPAMSEYFLETKDQRFRSLLKAANGAGIKLYVDKSILNEVAGHFRFIVNKYNDEYKDNESIYEENENIKYIKEIILRSYFYAKNGEKVKNFDLFIETFVNKQLVRIEDDIASWLKEEYGIKIYNFSDVKIEPQQLEQLEKELGGSTHKGSKQVKTDANLFLSIYGLRIMNNEMDAEDITGYRTWWLSTDTTTFKAAQQVFKDSFPISCYMRPAFLQNFLALAPKKRSVDKAYQHIFPNLIGIKISHNVPDGIISGVQEMIKDHGSKNQGRVRAMLRNLSDDLKTGNFAGSTKQDIKSYFAGKIG